MEWKVNGNLKTSTVGGQQNVVVQVTWVCKTTSQGVTINMNGTTDMEYNPSNPFIQYESLTEAEVIGWVKTTLGTDAVEFYETKTQELLDIELNDTDRTGTVFECWSEYIPVKNKPTPWSN